MKKMIRLCFCMLALLLAMAQPLSAAAATLNTAAPCSLTLHYVRENTPFQNLKIEIFRVAAYESDGSYALTAPFTNYPVKIHGIQSQKEWQESTQAMVSYVKAEALSPTVTGKTDATGTVVFQNLTTGLYLVMDAEAQTEAEKFRFQPFFMFLPTPTDSGNDYDVEAYPKPGAVTPVNQYKVVKLWKDSGISQKRPSSVTVEILKDGVLQETVTLSQENNWSYTWTAKDASGQWTVTEKNVPAGYNVAISSQNGIFTITNEYPQDPGIPPKTGDSTQLWFYIVALCGSGLALILLGSPRKRKQA